MCLSVFGLAWLVTCLATQPTEQRSHKQILSLLNTWLTSVVKLADRHTEWNLKKLNPFKNKRKPEKKRKMMICCSIFYFVHFTKVWINHNIVTAIILCTCFWVCADFAHVRACVCVCVCVSVCVCMCVCVIFFFIRNHSFFLDKSVFFRMKIFCWNQILVLQFHLFLW